ncbi:MAG: NADH-quinone oxidoreductase subunit A [Chloroflexi bacterium HGW-Chloroflexi-10]|nr:MAG: NADH-quinone oxidoreductase subunit A [Chloroflexi bacterium HGW-Chloroflexi-10]
MLSQWLYIGIFLGVSLFLPAVAILLARILSPKKPNKIKNSVYECGIETYQDTWIQFRIQYYLYALVFLIFDVETVFLFPFAVAYNQLGLFAVIEAVVFILILLGGYLYIWKKGALIWR